MSDYTVLPQYKQYQALLKDVFTDFGGRNLGRNLEWEQRDSRMKNAAAKGDKALQKEIKAICEEISSHRIEADNPGAWSSLELFLNEVVKFTNNEEIKKQLDDLKKLRADQLDIKKQQMMKLFLSEGLRMFGAQQMATLFRESQKHIQSKPEAMLNRVLEEAKMTGERYSSACANAVFDPNKWVWYQYFQAVFGLFSFIGIAISDDAAREIQPQHETAASKENVRYIHMRGGQAS